MPATVIVGLQWGDEGKGKTTDFLAEQVAMAVRYQGGDNAGHTVVLGDEVFKLRLTPVGRALPAHHLVIGTGRRGQPGHADRRARHARRARHRRRQGPGQPERARDHAVPRRPRPGERGPARRREGRDDRTAGSARPTPTGRRASACGWRTSSTRRPSGDRLGAGPARQEPRSSARWPARRRSRSSRSSRQALAWGERLRAAPRRHDLARPGRAAPAASTSCSRAPRARSSTSTTAATRT